MRKPLDSTAISLMMVLCALWGLQQVALKVAAPSLNPVLQIGIRSLVATVLLLLTMAYRGERIFRRDHTLGAGIVAGVAFSGEFLFVAIGLLYTTASHMVVFLYTMPVFAALGLHWFIPGERLSPIQWSGIFLAFVGIVCAFSSSFFAVDTAQASRVLIGDVLGIIAGILWAATTVIIRATVLSETPATKTLLYQLSCAAIVLTPVGYLLFQHDPIQMTPTAWASMAFQSLLVAFVSLLAWFWLLRRYLASRLSVFSFMTPLFGVGFGVLLLNDPLDNWFIAGAVLVSAGITLVNLRRA